MAALSSSHNDVLRDFTALEVLAASAVLDADAILVCAGAGMSIHDEETGVSTCGNVYIDPNHFASKYPGMRKYGYRTCYETMGLSVDPNVPLEVKRGFMLMHMKNMSELIPPTPGYAEVLRLCKRVEAKNRSGDEPAFWVWSSNVDGCFLRAGFPEDRIYTPQGDMKWFQCKEATCSGDSMWAAKPVLDELLHFVDKSTCWLQSDKLRAEGLKCPRCGSHNTFANLRGGNWFSHHAVLEAASARLESWLEGIVAARKKLVVLELGCGMNTPTVTRLPMEAVARATRDAILLRVNPLDNAIGPSVPFPRGMSLSGGWRLAERLNVILDLCGKEGEEGQRNEANLKDALLVATKNTRRVATSKSSPSTAISSVEQLVEEAAAAHHKASSGSSEPRALRWCSLSARYQNQDWKWYLANLRRD